MSSLRGTKQTKAIQSNPALRGKNTSKLNQYKYQNQTAIDTINKYNELMNSGGWMSADDLTKYNSAIETYKTTGTALRDASKFYGAKYTEDEEKSWLDSLASLSNSYTSANELYSSFADADQFTNWWNYNTGKNKYHSVTGAEDYLQNSQYVKGGQDSRYDFINQGKGYSVPIAGMGADDLVAGFTSWLPDPARDAIGSALGYSEPLPDVDYSEFISDFFTGLVKGNPDAAMYTNNGDLELTDEEIGVYNYYYATQGKEKADEYLKYIEEEVRQRKAGIDYANFKAADNLMDALLKVDTGNLGEHIYRYGAGVESGIAGWINDSAMIKGTEGYTPASQYVGSMIYNDFSGENGELTFDQVVSDLAYTIGNMTPSMMVGGATGPLGGAIAMGLSTAGNNYTSFLKENYGVDAARAYGIITGVSEAGMSYLFSGIGKLGGKLTSKLAGNISSGLNNAAARIAVDFGKSFVGEAFEEAAQSALEPVFKWAATLGEAELEAVNWEEVGYSALLGGLSGGMLEGVPSLVQTGLQSHAAYTEAGGTTIGSGVEAALNAVFNREVSEDITKNAQNVTDKAVEYANQLESIDPGNKAAQYVLKQAENGKNISGYQINRLANEINETNTEAVKSAVKSRLTELGEGVMAGKVADVITKVQLGQPITAAEEAILNRSKNAYLVLTESDVSNIKGGGLANKWSESILKNLDSKNNGQKVKTPIAVRPEDEETETVNAENSGKRVEAVETIAADKLAGNKINQEASEAMVKGYDGKVSASEYSKLYQAAYDAGASGKAQSSLSKLINRGLSQQAAFTAYDIGKNSVLKSDAEGGIINTESAEAKNEGGEGVHLRGSVQRNNGENTEGQLSRVEKDSGKTEGGRKDTRNTAESEAARLVHEGREVTVADLGIPGGSKSQKVYRLEGVEETAEMKKARKAAEKRGLVVRFFAGDNLMIETKDGTIENVRGYIQGKYVYIRADHPYYTADQIMRHELGHDMVAKGEVSIKKVRERLTELVGEENVEAVLEQYVAAYESTPLTDEEIWEEIVCDSLGDMNIFAGDKVISEFMAPMLKDIKQATQETKGEANKTRGAPTVNVLYNKRSGKNGWGKNYTAQEALNAAVEELNADLWQAFNKEFENAIDIKNPDTPITDALVAVQEDVRQDTITPIQGAKLLDEAYKTNGVKGLRSIVNRRNGNLYDRYLEHAKKYDTVPKGKASYAGIGAESADFDSLRLAQEMTMNGADSEQVRRETGWFRSYDGKWRFEIDDSTAVWHLDTAKPDAERLWNFGERIFKLGDLLDHPDLYKAYPQLKDVTVWENPDAKTTGYVVGKSTDHITVQSLTDTNIHKDILIHEIQHLIQHIEGFATGASIEQFEYKAWGEKEFAAYEKRNEIASKIYPTLRRHGVSITKADIAAVRTAFEITDGIIDYNFMLVGSLADSNAKIDALYDEYLAQVQILQLTTPSGQYHAVAGEIEAYDAQARRRKTAEERKNTRPNIDRTDVVFADGTSVSYFAKNQKNEEADSVKMQLRDHLEEINEMEPVANINYHVTNKMKAKQDAKDLYKTKGMSVERQNFGRIEMGDNEVELSSNYANNAAEFAAWMTIPNVLKRGRLISGHSNHKGQGFPTYTFAAPVVINGKRGNIAVVVRKTGKYHYKMHRILMPDGSVYVYNDVNKNAEPTGSDIASKASKGPDISSASKYSIPQNLDLSTPSAKKFSEGKASREFNSPEEAKRSGEVSDAKFSIEFADDIAEKQRKFVADGLSMISAEELEQAIADTARMVEEMKPYANILPQDKVGKTLVKNGSYDVSVENTTVCIRTLAYNSFVDMVSEKVGRPLTQMESFLVSQKLYEIAKEPQCLYCYVSLDRKAFNEMVIRYTQQRDEAIKAYEAAGKPKVPSSFNAEWGLFKEFLDGRKPTKNMWDRYVGWINAYNKGERLVSLADISTEAKRLELVEAGGEVASQVKDMLKYAQSASWAKKQTQYVAYYDEILKLKPAVIRNLNSHYGMRWYSFSDYSGAFIVENMQQITDAAIRGLKGLSYTKDTDFAEIFAPTGMNINISVYAKKDGKGGYEIDAKQSANIEEAIKLRNKYPNVGIVVVATDAAGVEWAMEREWSDVVIPFHTVRTGADVAEFYNWEIFNSEQSDTVADQNLWDAYVNSVGKKKASKMVYPSEHQNNQETYLRICEERGLTPRFKSFLNNPNYMKLVNETRQSEGQTKPLKAEFNLEAAERSFDKFVEKGGYYEGWYNDGIDVDNEADIVAEDVKAGRKANEVSYGRQDVDFDDVAKSRKTNRQHGKASRELDLIDYINEQGDERAELEGVPLTNREILANALESATQSEEELESLKAYKKNIKELNKKAYVLSKLKEDIKRLSFAKGQKDTAKINELKEKAKKVEGSINYYDRQLTKLEAMKPVKDLIQRERSKAYKAAAEKGRQALKRNVEGRHKSEARAKIKGLKEKFMGMLEHPTERQYVPSDLVSAMVKVCELVDTSTALIKSNGEINKAQQARNEQMQRLINLAAEYKKIKNNPDAMIAEEYEAEIADYLDEIVSNYASKNIADMTLDELNELYRTMKAIEETLRDARKLIGWTDAESVYDAGDSIIEEQRGIAATRKQNGITRADDVVVNMSLSPMRAVLRMGGYNEDSALYRAMRDIERGTREQKKFVMDAVKKFESLTTGKNADVYEKAIYDPYGKELVDKNGKKFHVTKMQMMQAVMSYEREMANEKLHHVSNGGFTFADIDLLGKGEIREAVSAKNAHTVTLGAELALQFQMELANDQWAQDYMAEARRFFDETAKDAINEANMKLKHRIIATGKNYIPYEVNSDYIVREITSENDIQQVISGYGMLKDLKAGATQPIIITGLNNVLDRHIEQVGNVAALAVPIRNFNKIWNVKAADGSTTVKEAISNNWGTRGTDLITQAVKDVQGSRIQDRSDLYKAYKVVKSNIIGATFLGNVSVVLKQVGSMYTATSMLGWRNPVSMIGNLFATKANRDAIAAEVNKYTAVAWIRGQGLSDAELYELKTAKKKSKIGRAIDKLPNAVKATSWITQMDYDVALSLWKYAKEDVAKRTGLEGEELLQATAEYYNDVIENTQSMSDALHRPEIQKSDNIASETLGIFKTDLYQSAGLLRVAVENVKANPGKESNKALVKALGGTFMSMCWGSLITSLMAALRYKPDRYRDDEDDEITLGSWLKVAAGDMVEEMFGYAFPLFGSEAAGIISAFINGESYEFDNLTLDAVNDLLKAFTSVGATFNEEDFFSEKAGKAWKNLLIKAAAVFGVPANNVTRFIDAVRLHAQDIANGEFLSFEAGLTSKNPTRLYNAYIDGDADKIEKASRNYEDEKAVNEALRLQLRERDPRMQEIAQCELLGDTKRSVALEKDIVAEGHFDKDEVVGKAINAEINYVKEKLKDLKTAQKEGKTEDAEAIIKALIKRGYTQAFIDAYLKKIS